MALIPSISATTFLRLGLGLTYLYSAYDIFVHPTAWYWALRPLPQSLQTFIHTEIGATTYLRAQAAGEFALALVFLLWFVPRRWVRLAAGIAALEMVLILVFVGFDAVTFRDIGLLGAALALVTLLRR